MNKKYYADITLDFDEMKYGITCEAGTKKQELVDLVKQYGIKQAPTLSVNGQMIVNVSNIKKYIGETCTTA